MSRGPDAATLVERALVADAARHDVALTVDGTVSTPWASATFTGARHVMEVTLTGDGARVWLGQLAEADLPLRGHLLADLAVVAIDGVSATIEALTVEER